MSAKSLRVELINSCAARAAVKRWHYSKTFVNNSQIHFGVFWEGALAGVMLFGPPMMRAQTLALLRNTPWGGVLELNRMAFSDALPRNSESRALSVALRFIRKNYPFVRVVISFADATQCGDGTIYRASGFVLTGVKKNTSIRVLEDGSKVTKFSLRLPQNFKDGREQNPPALSGHQLRYMFFLDPSARADLAVPVLPFSEIDARGARMYKGVASARGAGGGDHPSQAVQVRPGRSTS